MSLAIDVDEVTAVLLQDGWHQVSWVDGKSTFSTDAYDVLIYGSDERKENGRHIASYQPDDCATGFTFRAGDEEICGPMTSILAIKVKRS